MFTTHIKQGKSKLKNTRVGPAREMDKPILLKFTAKLKRQIDQYKAMGLPS